MRTWWQQLNTAAALVLVCLAVLWVHVLAPVWGVFELADADTQRVARVVLTAADCVYFCSFNAGCIAATAPLCVLRSPDGGVRGVE
eukprot:1149496-Pelagomonas_calceolata.AAC.3